jgi:uncharacterized DUF497 family protein
VLPYGDVPRHAAFDFPYLRKTVDNWIFCSYIISVITWDEAKRAANLAKHGLDFADVIQFDFDTALHDVDDREEYGEVREIAIGWCGTRLCFLVFVRHGDDEIRVISFRRATRPEMRRYAKS